MLDARMHARLTENYKDAAAGYANASAAAMNAFAQQAMDFWSAPSRAAAPAAARRDHLSWFNPNGSTSHWGAAPAPFNPWLAMMPWAQPAERASVPANPLQAFMPWMQSPVQAPAASVLPFNPWLALTPWAQPAAPAPAPFNPWLAFTPWAQRPATAPQLNAMSMAFMPFAFWWGTAMRGPTFAWPMAYSMIAHGVPDSVAWPTAEANAAVLDATAVLAEQAQQTFASYQSAGGFAMAHVWAPKTLTAFAALAPLAAIWPVPGTQPSLF